MTAPTSHRSGCFVLMTKRSQQRRGERHHPLQGSGLAEQTGGGHTGDAEHDRQRKYVGHTSPRVVAICAEPVAHEHTAMSRERAHGLRVR